MWIYLIATLFFGGLLGAVIMLASKSGSKAEQVENLKAELRKIAQEQARANEISNNVTNLAKSDVYSLLQKTDSNKR